MSAVLLIGLVLVVLVVGAVVVGGIVAVVMLVNRKAPANRPPNAPAPGWYPDPQQPGTVRYFDGTAWTTQSRPA